MSLFSNLNYPIIVLAIGGTGGDLVSAVIDDTDTSMSGSKIELSNKRRDTKGKHVYAMGSDEYISYIKSVSSKFKSVSSHNTDAILASDAKYIGVIVTNADDAVWAAKRFAQFYPKSPSVATADAYNHYLNNLINYGDYIKKKATLVVSVTDIRRGNLINILQPHFDFPLSTTIYLNWLNAQPV